MKRALQILAAVIATSTLGLWLTKSDNGVWTKNKVTETKIDPVTELSYPVTHDKFVPGLDFLAVGLFSGAALAIASRFIRTNNKPITSKQNQA